jgi:hypothetical protein
MRPSTLGTWLLVVALAAAGCSDTINVTPPSEPSAPVERPDPITEEFGGNVVQGGEIYHAVVARAGEVTTTMTAIGPDASASVGMSVGILNTFACSALMENPSAVVGSRLLAAATGTTTICVRVFDNGTLAPDSTLSYLLTIKYVK